MERYAAHTIVSWQMSPTSDLMMTIRLSTRLPMKTYLLGVSIIRRVHSKVIMLHISDRGPDSGQYPPGYECPTKQSGHITNSSENRIYGTVNWVTIVSGNDCRLNQWWLIDHWTLQNKLTRHLNTFKGMDQPPPNVLLGLKCVKMAKYPSTSLHE